VPKVQARYFDTRARRTDTNDVRKWAANFVILIFSTYAIRYDERT
jgi:hypothetical protein